MIKYCIFITVLILLFLFMVSTVEAKVKHNHWASKAGCCLIEKKKKD